MQCWLTASPPPALMHRHVHDRYCRIEGVKRDMCVPHFWVPSRPWPRGEWDAPNTTLFTWRSALHTTLEWGRDKYFSSLVTTCEWMASPPPPPPNISSAWTVLYRYIHCSVDRYFLHSGSSTKGESSRYEGTRMPSEGGGVLPSSSPGLSERRGGLLSALRPPLTWILQTHSLPPEGKLCPFQHSSGGAGCGTLGPACSKVATRWLSCWMAASTAQSHFPPEWKSTRPDADYSCPVVGCGGVVTVNCHCVWATRM